MESLEWLVGRVGWAGAALLNQKTGHLIDGHGRKRLPSELLVDGKMPVLVGEWEPEDEEVLLAALDPLAAMAKIDESKLDELLRGIEIEPAALQDHLISLLGDVGAGDMMPEPEDGESIDMPQVWDVLVECSSEDEQARALLELERGGFKCRALMS